MFSVFRLSKFFAGVFMVLALLLTACGTLQVGLETTAEPAAVILPTVADAAIGEPTDLPEPAILVPETPTPPAVALLDDATVTPTLGDGDTATVIGRAMTLDPGTGFIQLLPEDETPLTNEFGFVSFRISEWARIADTEGSIVFFDDFTRGVKLQVAVTLQNGELVADDVVVLAPGNPRPEDNPAMTDVTGLVTPIADANAGQATGPISLFEILGADQPVDPGAAVTLRWAYSGEGGSICAYRVPRPVNQTCYLDLPTSGELMVEIPAEARDAVDYTLYVPSIREGERVARETVRVPLTVALECQYEWFYEPEYLLECPGGPAVAIRAQAQHFENGMLIRVENGWLGEAPYLFMWQWYEDTCQGQYCAISEGPLLDIWEPGIPETDLALRPPEGLLQPSRGFGMLWRGEIEILQMGEPRTVEGLNQLGWATGRVFEYDARYQCESLNENFGIFNCHLELPDGRLAVLPGEIR